MSAEMSGGARPTPAQAWVLAARPKTLPAACVPVVVGTGAAVGSHHFALLPALAALFGALLLQIGANFANDVFDFFKGADTHERLGPTRVTQAGLLTPKQVLVGMAVVFGLATLVGCYLVYVGGWPIVAVGLLAIVSAIAYTGGPFPLGYNGLGEVFVFLFFGLAAVGGTYYVQAGTVSPAAWGAAVPIGLLAVNILVVNNLRDIATDTAAGKRTVAVRLGRQGTLGEYAVFLLSAYAAPLIMALLRGASWWVLLTWLSLPLALRVWKQVSTAQGRALNPALGATAQLELVYGALFAVGLSEILMIAQRQNLRELDWLMLGSVLLIAVGGVFAIHSAAHADRHALDFVRKQGVGIALGLAAMLAVGLADYGTLLKRFAPPLYYANLVLLGIVLLHFGHSSHGAARWIGLGPVQVQPSEFAKIILIGTLALFLVGHSETIREWRTVGRAFGHIALPMLLIAKQPDLGTALVILAIWFGMMAVAGARPAHLLAVFLAGVVLFAGMWQFHVLKPYQKNRLIVFLRPDADPKDTGYHLHQSEIAIGSGQLTGEGYGRGAQSNGRFIPEQHTDFIFTVVGEEGGFVTCLILLALYLFVLERGVLALALCDDVLGRLLAAGVLTMLTFHVVVNVGMTMGVMPVVGVPLPFFSYGLSSLLVNMTAVGLLLSVAARRHRVIF